MIFNCIRIFFAIFLVLPAQAEEKFEFRPRPPLAVFDPESVRSAEANDLDKVKASATEAADMPRIWMGGAITQTVDIQTEAAKMRLELEAQSRRWKLGVMIAAAAFIPLVAGIVLGVSLLNRRGPRYFSSNHWQRRLGAPYAGGNRAVADLGTRIP